MTFLNSGGFDNSNREFLQTNSVLRVFFRAVVGCTIAHCNGPGVAAATAAGGGAGCEHGRLVCKALRCSAVLPLSFLSPTMTLLAVFRPGGVALGDLRQLERPGASRSPPHTCTLRVRPRPLRPSACSECWCNALSHHKQNYHCDRWCVRASRSRRRRASPPNRSSRPRWQWPARCTPASPRTGGSRRRAHRWRRRSAGSGGVF